MDPNENLRLQLKLAEYLVDNDPKPGEFESTELAELVLDLHEWLRKGGFLPSAWARGAK